MTPSDASRGGDQVYQIEGRWAFTDDPNWQTQPGGGDVGTWPHVGHWTGTAIRDESGVSIFGDLTDCDGQYVGTLQADGLSILPGYWYRGAGWTLKTLGGSQVLAETGAFTFFDDSISAGHSQQFCSSSVFTWCCRLQ